MYMIFKWIILMMKPLSGYALLYICLHDHDYVMDFYFMVILCSITIFYGRLMIEVAYGKMLLSLHRSCMGVDSSGRVMGCRHDVAHVGQT